MTARAKKLASLFRINNQPVDLSPGQLQILEAILYQDSPRYQIIAPTQYGKSLTVALGLILHTVAYGSRWTILAPSEKKTQIIMGHIIEHLFDDRIFSYQLELESDSQREHSAQLELLKRARSKKHITLKSGGAIQTLTLDARSKARSVEAAMGFGSQYVILDESALIDDVLYATVKRMLGGYEYKDTFLLEIGNPFYRNHFHRTWHESRYHKIFIDYKQALAEGRFDQEFIEEMQGEALFDVLYECRFPEETEIDAKGYRQLLTTEQIVAAQVDEVDTTGELKLGVDVGGGRDLNAYIGRNQKNAWIEGTNQSKDTMVNVAEVQRIVKYYDGLQPEGKPNETKGRLESGEVYIDDIGIGRGVTDRCKEKKEVKDVVPVSVGERPVDRTRYSNRRAENFWELRKWILAGGKLKRDDRWLQLSGIRYKVNSDKVISIEPKQELVNRTGKSPDIADGLMLSFTQKPKSGRVFSKKPSGL